MLQIALILVAVLVYFCWKTLKRQLALLEEQDRAKSNVARRSARQPSGDADSGKAPAKRDTVETLTRDPETGIYRVEKD